MARVALRQSSSRVLDKRPTLGRLSADRVACVVGAPGHPAERYWRGFFFGKSRSASIRGCQPRWPTQMVKRTQLGSECVALPQHFKESLDQDLDVEPKAPIAIFTRRAI
jgi:hypothetical protein